MSTTVLRRAQVVDVNLTAIAQGTLAGNQFIGEQVLPTVKTPKVAGKYMEWGSDAFRVFDPQRSLGDSAKRIDFGNAVQSYTMPDGYTLEVAIDDREDMQTVGISNINFSKQKLASLIHAMNVFKEKKIADLVTTAGNYDDTQEAVDSWATHTSDILNDVELAKEKCRANIGVMPNVLVVAPKTLSNLKKNTKLAEWYKYTKSGILPVEVIAEALGVEKILVGMQTYKNNAGAIVNIWGTDFASLLYIGQPQGGAAIDPQSLPPSFGWTLQLDGMPRVRRYRDEPRGSEVIALDENFLALNTSKGAGCLITGTA